MSEIQNFWYQSEHKDVVEFCINSVYPVSVSTACSEQKKNSEKIVEKRQSSKTPPRGRYQDFLVRARTITTTITISKAHPAHPDFDNPERSGQKKIYYRDVQSTFSLGTPGAVDTVTDTFHI